MIVQEPVQASIWFLLNHYSYSDAIFLAERLNAEVGSEEALYLLATCYYRSGKANAAYLILSNKGCKSSECRLLLAKCCVDLKKFSEGEYALLGSNFQSDSKLSKLNLATEDLINDFGESASFAAQLLATICSKTERLTKAVDYYKKSLKLNPFLWSSFEQLVELGARPDAQKMFSISNVDYNLCHGNNPLISLWNVNNHSNLLKTSDTNSVSKNLSSFKTSQLSKFDIHSPFAVIKPATESGSIDVITPDNNNWVTTCFAPQKQPPAKITRKTSNSSENVSSNIVMKTDSPLLRLSFGIFPLGETPTLPNTIITDDSKSRSLDSTTRVTRAPVKKPQTRRNQQQQIQQSQSIVAHSTRSTAPKLQLSGNINTLNTDSGLQSTSGALITQPVQQSLRRSSRLFSSSNSVKENNKTQESRTRSVNQENNKNATSSKTPTKKTRRQSNSSSTITSNSTSNQQKESELNEINKPQGVWLSSNSMFNEEIVQTGLKMQKDSAEGLLNLLTPLGNALCFLGQFQCQKAIDVLLDLPLKHQKTGWVLNTLGRSYFEMAKYDEAVNYFEQGFQCEPHRLPGTEYYSTALWHLQREVKLSKLAQDLIEFDKNSPQTWCVAGNCFSLQKEHETAIKFLQRAIQVDPDFSYAYTLLGHELVLTEEMDHAMACFRNAIRINSRHYNAWYGIGMIYYKQEKYQLAELHYRKALQITPISPVLKCHIGVVQHALKKTDLALQTLNEAIETDPKNALCKFHRASIYFSMDKHQLALSELDQLKQIVPKESLVYFLIGKVHKRLGNTHLALMNFSWAMDLDPKGANNQIKEVIDKQYANDDDEVVVMVENNDDNNPANISNDAGSTSSRRRSEPPTTDSSSSMEAEEDDDDEDEDNNDANGDEIEDHDGAADAAIDESI